MRSIAALVMLLAATPALSQTDQRYADQNRSAPPGTICYLNADKTTCTIVSAANPLPVTGGGGSGSSGQVATGATSTTATPSQAPNGEALATKANQATQITAEQAIQAQMRDGSQIVRAVTSTPTAQGGSVAAGSTLAIAFINTNDTEVINPSTATFWCSWGTPAANGAGSYPILANGYYRPPNRVAGTLTCLNPTASAANLTVTRF